MKTKTILLHTLTVFLVCFYPCAFCYLGNVGEAAMTEMLPMLGVFLFTAVIIFAAAVLIMKDMDSAGLYTALTMLIFCNSGILGRFLKSYFGWFRDRYLLIVIAIVLVVFLLFLRKHRKFPAKECCMILAILFSALTVIKLIPALPTVYKVVTFQKAELEVEEHVFQGEKPNVYLFLLDEYGGPENLQRYYDFENEEFTEFLEERDFNIAQSSKNTESIWTSTLVPNLMNLDYVVEDKLPERVKFRYLEDPLLFRLFRENGYEINLICHKDFIGEEGCNLLNEPQFPDRITVFLFDNSIFSQIPGLRTVLRGLLELDDFRNHAEHVREIFSWMEVCGDYVGKNPTLTVSYVQSPHYPFVFDEEGNVVDGGQNIKDKHFYLDQLAYVNTVLMTGIDNILAQDPNSIILLQSDHGTRYPGQMLLYYGEPDYDPYLETPYMQNVLNCVYYKGEALEIEGETGINTWRKLLGEEFGLRLEEITPPTGYTCYGRSWKDKPKDFGR